MLQSILRDFAYALLESYALAVLLLWIFSRLFTPFRLREVGVLSNLNLIGISLGMLAIIGNVNDYALLISRQYQSQWLQLIYLKEYLALSMVVNSLALMVFYSKKRREDMVWTFIAGFLLLLPKILDPIRHWFMEPVCGSTSNSITMHFFSFSYFFWWFSWVFVVVFLGGAYYFALKSKD